MTMSPLFREMVEKNRNIMSIGFEVLLGNRKIQLAKLLEMDPDIFVGVHGTGETLIEDRIVSIRMRNSAADYNLVGKVAIVALVIHQVAHFKHREHDADFYYHCHSLWKEFCEINKEYDLDFFGLFDWGSKDLVDGCQVLDGSKYDPGLVWADI
ncbi:hypothetical protein H4219_002140 [Mycoemilia scoparia]|uniref:WLM domain-containing protein n=1 Tax=Mycoemilia scoparia TaxID=417184 RepID=A0A9W8DV63_9FUNG|nr:hypothetical protein H4219_002140 [Mycoemilia scoparia]